MHLDTFKFFMDWWIVSSNSYIYILNGIWAFLIDEFLYPSYGIYHFYVCFHFYTLLCIASFSCILVYSYLHLYVNIFCAILIPWCIFILDLIVYFIHWCILSILYPIYGIYHLYAYFDFFLHMHVHMCIVSCFWSIHIC